MAVAVTLTNAAIASVDNEFHAFTPSDDASAFVGLGLGAVPRAHPRRAFPFHDPFPVTGHDMNRPRGGAGWRPLGCRSCQARPAYGRPAFPDSTCPLTSSAEDLASSLTCSAEDCACCLTSWVASLAVSLTCCALSRALSCR